MTTAVEVTEANFDGIADREGIVLLDFWATWCGPCRTFAPIFEAAARRHPDVTFGKVNSDDQRGLAGLFQIRAIPTLVVMRDGLVLGIQSGVMPGAALDKLIEEVKALDINQVRKNLDPQQHDNAKLAAGGKY